MHSVCYLLKSCVFGVTGWRAVFSGLLVGEQCVQCVTDWLCVQCYRLKGCVFGVLLIGLLCVQCHRLESCMLPAWQWCIRYVTSHVFGVLPAGELCVQCVADRVAVSVWCGTIERAVRSVCYRLGSCVISVLPAGELCVQYVTGWRAVRSVCYRGWWAVCVNDWCFSDWRELFHVTDSNVVYSVCYRLERGVFAMPPSEVCIRAAQLGVHPVRINGLSQGSGGTLTPCWQGGRGHVGSSVWLITATTHLWSQERTCQWHYTINTWVCS